MASLDMTTARTVDMADGVAVASFECGECGDTFDTERGRDSHIDQVHGRPWHDADLLRELYVERGLSSGDIAQRFGAADNTIRDNLRRHGIPVRSTKASHRRKVPVELRDPDRLHGLYHGEGLTAAGIAGRVGVEQSTVTRWMSLHGIEARGPPTGEDSPHWKPDAERVTYGRGWDAKRREARERDGNTCRVCAYAPDDHNLDVHHIRPVETFDVPADAHYLDNLVTLCRPCHRRWEGIPLRPGVA